LVSEDDDERITHNPLVAEILEIDTGKNCDIQYEQVKPQRTNSFVQKLNIDDLEQYVSIDK
jgi:hypothetical protein